jgi:ketosteroid isomerase-like protein
VGYLSDVARRRIAAVALVVIAVIAVLAITDSAFFEDPPTEGERVAATVQEFFAAAAEEDFKRTCELLSPTAQATVRASAARLITEAKEELSCSEVLAQVIGESFAGVVVRVRGEVSISGNRARVETALKPEGEPSEFRTILLEESDKGGWLISDFG